MEPLLLFDVHMNGLFFIKNNEEGEGAGEGGRSQHVPVVCLASGRLWGGGISFSHLQALSSETVPCVWIFRQEKASFRELIAQLELDPKCKGLPFSSFLILPFQRITRLKLLVQV